MSLDPALEAALRFTLAQEGGWSDDPDDRGGATNFGITLATLQSERPGATAADVAALTQDEARAIYRRRYWLWGPEHGIPDDVARAVPARVRAKHFDVAVNCGPAEATKQLQSAVNLVRPTVDGHALLDVDGHLGLRTATGAASCDADALLSAMCSAQALHYRAIAQANPSQTKFLAGWLKRAARIPAVS